MRVDDVGRRIASSSGALLWQQVAVEIIGVCPRKANSNGDSDPISPGLLSGLISPPLLSLSGGIKGRQVPRGTNV